MYLIFKDSRVWSAFSPLLLSGNSIVLGLSSLGSASCCWFVFCQIHSPNFLTAELGIAHAHWLLQPSVVCQSWWHAHSVKDCEREQRKFSQGAPFFCLLFFLVIGDSKQGFFWKLDFIKRACQCFNSSLQYNLCCLAAWAICFGSSFNPVHLI